MEITSLLFITLAVSLFAFVIEKHVSWVAYFSGVCMIVLTALLLSTFHLIPQEGALYDFFLGPAVPVTLACMVLGLNLKDVRFFPKRLIYAFTIGAIGTMLGGIAAAFVGSFDQGADAAKLAAQLTASYIGGGENVVAIQQILGVEHEKFLACFAVDNIVTSVWMIITIIGVRRCQASKQKKQKSSSHDLKKEGDLLAVDINSEETPSGIIDFLTTMVVALGCTIVSKLLSSSIGGIHPLLYISLIAFLVGQIPFLKPHLKQSYLLGSLAFAPFFFSMGAISDIHQLATIPKSIIMMPFVVVTIHGLVIYTFCRKWIPEDEISLTSQTLVGGVGTAVALAQTCSWKEGISIGVILGTLGYVVANFLGMSVFYASEYLLSLVSAL